jgi:predicted aldo/keto reductase-like oxidoreductase
MIYKKFKDKEISWLGYGAMRFPVLGPKGPIDEEKAFEIIDIAIKNGVNYYDTAYFYHHGHSQAFLGKALSRYPRESWYVANKMPGNIMSKAENGIKIDNFGEMKGHMVKDLDEIFFGQLRKLGVDYFDFYMLHNLSEGTYGLYTDEALGIINYLLEQKKAGRITHLGFSTHARPETIEKFLIHNDNHKIMEYCQLQLNYLDYGLQEAGKKYDILEKFGIPVIVMEGVRGGALTDPKPEALKLLKAAKPGDTPARWAFRYLQKFPMVFTVLSGMTTKEQLTENIEIFSKNEPITDDEQKVLDEVVKTMADLVPCTACRYCVDACPKGLDIPMLLSGYGEYSYAPAWTIGDILSTLKEDELPKACINCGACNPLCPQNIDIPDLLAKFDGLLQKKKEA